MAGKAKSKRAGKAAPAQRKKPKGTPSKAVKAAPKRKASKPAAKAKAGSSKTATKGKAAAKGKPSKSIAAKGKAKKPAPAKPVKSQKPDGAFLQTEILAMARQVYGDRSDDELLALDPNEVDEMDPSTFYEMVGEKYGVQADDQDQNFGGFGGPIEKLIAFVGARWDGKTRRDAPMPPKEWLDEFVHPATERVPQQAEPQDEPLLD